MSSAIGKVEEQLTCPLCLDVLESPTIIGKCGHSFCYACLKELTEKKSKTLLQCPVCRAYYMLGLQGIDALAPNILLHNVIEELRSNGSLAQGEVREREEFGGAVGDGGGESAPDTSSGRPVQRREHDAFGSLVLGKPVNKTVLERPGRLLNMKANDRLK